MTEGRTRVRENREGEEALRPKEREDQSETPNLLCTVFHFTNFSLLRNREKINKTYFLKIRFDFKWCFRVLLTIPIFHQLICLKDVTGTSNDTCLTELFTYLSSFT